MAPSNFIWRFHDGQRSAHEVAPQPGGPLTWSLVDDFEQTGIASRTLAGAIGSLGAERVHRRCLVAITDSDLDVVGDQLQALSERSAFYDRCAIGLSVIPIAGSGDQAIQALLLTAMQLDALRYKPYSGAVRLPNGAIVGDILPGVTKGRHLTLGYRGFAYAAPHLPNFYEGERLLQTLPSGSDFFTKTKAMHSYYCLVHPSEKWLESGYVSIRNPFLSHEFPDFDPSSINVSLKARSFSTKRL